jgi:hypothetical protein
MPMPMPMPATNRDQARRALFARRSPDAYTRYLTLPAYTPALKVRCPGCGRANPSWDDATCVYDCRAGCMFADYQADPPHQRTWSDRAGPDGAAGADVP